MVALLRFMFNAWAIGAWQFCAFGKRSKDARIRKVGKLVVAILADARLVFRICEPNRLTVNGESAVVEASVHSLSSGKFIAYFVS